MLLVPSPDGNLTAQELERTSQVDGQTRGECLKQVIRVTLKF